MNNHQTIITNIKPGDILLSRKKGSALSYTISGITKSYWSHALLYIGNNEIIESDWKVEINPLKKYLNNQYDVGLFRLKTPITESQTKKLIKIAIKKAGLRYGFLQLFWQLLLRIFGKSENPQWSLDIDKGMICSELIAYSYEQIGIQFKNNLPPHEIEPADLDESPLTIRII